MRSGSPTVIRPHRALVTDRVKFRIIMRNIAIVWLDQKERLQTVRRLFRLHVAFTTIS
jgi:hypothetical protein